MMVLEDFLKDMALGALDPQTSRNIGRLVPTKRTNDHLATGVYDFILLRNIVRRAEFGSIFFHAKTFGENLAF